MNNPFDYTPDKACDEAFRELLARLEKLKQSNHPKDMNFCRELEEGKMLGVLIAEDPSGRQHSLFAFSGQVGENGFYYDGFVGGAFDYLQPDGYFKTKEADISRQNREIDLFETGELAEIRNFYQCEKARREAEIEDFKGKCRLSKLQRKTRRESDKVCNEDLEMMIRQSQFEKAELRRNKKRVSGQLKPIEKKLLDAESFLASMKEKRRKDSEELQKWLFNNFKLLNARGYSKSLSEIFSETSLKVPPSGAGECCAPKLLQAAYQLGWTPIVIAEYWYGKPKDGELRRHGEYYPACRGKCRPILEWMLQGLDIFPPIENEYQPKVELQPEILYENRWFCVVSKPAGMLSVEGKVLTPSVEKWLENKFGKEKCVKLAHRLDQDTSGLIIATFGAQAFKVMQSLFATRKVKKSYVADLRGDYRMQGIPHSGCIELPLSADPLDRPRQRVDLNGGKESATEFEFLDVKAGHSRVIFRPLTGRTHQLRVHAASEFGLNMPIVGDRLYGDKSDRKSRRLHLHALKIEFFFPIDGRDYIFEIPEQF